MFAPPGYRDIYGIINAIKSELDFEAALYFPSLEDVPVKHLANLAWMFGEFDFLEEVVFQIALEAGLFLSSPEGRLMRTSMNPLHFSDASTTDLLDKTDLFLGLQEQLNLTVPLNINFEWQEGEDPRAIHRGPLIDGGQ